MEPNFAPNTGFLAAIGIPPTAQEILLSDALRGSQRVVLAHPALDSEVASFHRERCDVARGGMQGFEPSAGDLVGIILVLDRRRRLGWVE